MTIRIIRGLLIAAGLWLLWYGIMLLLGHNRMDLESIAMWVAGGILIHDGIFAPLCAALGVSARRLLPRTWWAPLATGTVATVTLLAVATPVLGRHHAMADNPTVLDRNYGVGLTVGLLVIWILVGLSVGITRYMSSRGNSGTTPRRTQPSLASYFSMRKSRDLGTR